MLDDKAQLKASFMNFVSTITDMIVPALLWIFFHPSLQAAISDVTKTVCTENCSNHGDCHVMKSVVFCVCHLGWGGNACEIQCSRSCVHGMCVFSGHGQLCICSPGYKGDICTEPGYDMSSWLNLVKLYTANSVNSLPLVLDPSEQVQANIQLGSNNCTGNFVCQNGGRCVNGHMGGYRCQCDASRYTGNFCQHTCPKPCQNGGTCVRLRRSESKTNIREVLSLQETDAIYRCICHDGFGGERCSRSLRTIVKANPSSGT